MMWYTQGRVTTLGAIDDGGQLLVDTEGCSTVAPTITF